MSGDPDAGPHPTDLQFDRADDVDGAPPEPLACTVCSTPLYSTYFEVNGQPACERCRFEAETAFQTSPGVGGFVRAAAAGLGAAVVGAGIYYAVLALSGYELGLIAILVGFMIGKAVRWGSKGRGGWAYQTLAVLLTYTAIVSTYIPLIFQELDEVVPETAATAAGTEPATGQPVPAASPVVASPPDGATPVAIDVGGCLLGVGVIFLMAAALPFLAGFENLIGLLIIAVALYEAWKLTKRSSLEITGPFQVGARPAAPPAAP